MTPSGHHCTICTNVEAVQGCFLFWQEKTPYWLFEKAGHRVLSSGFLSWLLICILITILKPFIHLSDCDYHSNLISFRSSTSIILSVSIQQVYLLTLHDPVGFNGLLNTIHPYFKQVTLDFIPARTYTLV